MRHAFLNAAVLSAALVAFFSDTAQSEQTQLTERKGKTAAQITILYDAFGKTSAMKKDWGFSAYIEYGGKKILFDTGNNAEIFAHNVQARGIDLTKLDFAVVSHRHGDHTGGLNYLLKVNPTAKIYASQENFGYSAPRCPVLSTGATRHCPLTSGILTEIRRSSYVLVLPGPM